MSRSFLTSLFEHKAWCNRELVKALRALPGDVDPRQWITILLTLDHTSIVDRIFKARLTGDEPGFNSVVADRMPDLERLAATLENTDAWYLDYVAHVTPAELDEIVEFQFVSDGEQGCMSRAQILAHVITHGASHRGAIGKMLENLKVAGAPDMVTTFVRQSAGGRLNVGT